MTGSRPFSELQFKSEYPKIETLFDRNPDDMKHVIVGQYRDPAFALVNRWLVTEKVDGTNVRVIFQEGKVRFGGKTDNAQMPISLLDRLNEMFTDELLQDVFPQEPDQDFDDVVLYGEGYGPKIQKGGGNYRTTPSFRLFDVKVNRWWLNWSNVRDVADKLGIQSVPVLDFDATIDEAIEHVLTTPSTVAAIENNTVTTAEGVVCRTDPLLFMRNGHRLIWKLKGRDLA